MKAPATQINASTNDPPASPVPSPAEIAVKLAKGWSRKAFRSEAAAIAWLNAHDGEYDEVRWASDAS